MRGNKKPYIIRILIAILIFLLSIFAFAPNFDVFANIFVFQFAPAIASLFIGFSVVAMIVIVLNIFIAYFFGRFYCSTICPFGILQDIIGAVLHRKSGKTKNLSVLRYLIFAIVVSCLIIGLPVVLRFFDPYSIFGGVASSAFNYETATFIGFIPLVAIIILVAIRNRIFCTSVCPVGTALGLCSKFGYNKLFINTDKCKKCGICEKNCPTGAINSSEQKIDNERCVRCMRCMGYCSFQAVSFGKNDEKIALDKSRRTFISAGIISVVAISLLAKGKDVAFSIIEKFKKTPICPPGTISPEIFTTKCTSCGLCVDHCKGNVLEKPNEEYETVHLNYQNGGSCQFDCNNCSDVCPTGAIKKMSLQEKQNCRIGMATLNLDDCLKCGECAQNCPKHAITQKNNALPEFDGSKCIGCGSCQSACPMNCIKIVAIKKQSISS